MGEASFHAFNLSDARHLGVGVYQERGGLPTVHLEWTEENGQRTERTFVVKDGHWVQVRSKGR